MKTGRSGSFDSKVLEHGGSPDALFSVNARAVLETHQLFTGKVRRLSEKVPCIDVLTEACFEANRDSDSENNFFKNKPEGMPDAFLIQIMKLTALYTILDFQLGDESDDLPRFQAAKFAEDMEVLGYDSEEIQPFVKVICGELNTDPFVKEIHSFLNDIQGHMQDFKSRKNFFEDREATWLKALKKHASKELPNIEMHRVARKWLMDDSEDGMNQILDGLEEAKRLDFLYTRYEVPESLQPSSALLSLENVSATQEEPSQNGLSDLKKACELWPTDQNPQENTAWIVQAAKASCDNKKQLDACFKILKPALEQRYENDNLSEQDKQARRDLYQAFQQRAPQQSWVSHALMTVKHAMWRLARWLKLDRVFDSLKAPKMPGPLVLTSKESTQ